MQIDEARYWIKSSIYDENSLRHALLSAETLAQHDPHLGAEVELDELRQLAKLSRLSESQLDKGEAMRESIDPSAGEIRQALGLAEMSSSGYWRSPMGENHGTDSKPGDVWVEVDKHGGGHFDYNMPAAAAGSNQERMFRIARGEEDRVEWRDKENNMTAKRPRIPRKEIEMLCRDADKWAEHIGIRTSSGYVLKFTPTIRAISKVKEFLAARWPHDKRKDTETTTCARCDRVENSFVVCVRDGVRMPYFCAGCRVFLSEMKV